MNKTLAAVALGTLPAASSAAGHAACLGDTQVADFAAAHQAQPVAREE